MSYSPGGFTKIDGDPRNYAQAQTALAHVADRIDDVIGSLQHAIERADSRGI